MLAVGPLAEIPAPIDDFSISDINATASSHNKVDLHMVDIFPAKGCNEAKASALVAKTCDLKSAYRRLLSVKIICVSPSSAFAIVSLEKLKCISLKRCLLAPRTHSVYSFLRLARMLYTIWTRELFLLTTNFYDDYILASLPNSVESAKNPMELVFMLTGWRFDIDGKKATSFGTVCKALGVQFDLSSSGERILAVRNAERV